MDNRKNLWMMIPIILTQISILAACQSTTTTPGLAQTPKTIPSESPIKTLVPTANKILPTISPTLTQFSKIISRDNIQNVEKIAQFGKGTITNPVVFSPGSDKFAVPATTGVFLYDSQTFEELAFLDTKSIVQNICYSPDATLLATGGTTNSVQIWSTGDGTLFTEIRLSPTDSLYIYQMDISPDGNLIAISYGPDNTVEVWGMQNQVLIQKYPGSWFSFSHDSKYLTTTELSGENINQRPIHLFDLSSGTELNSWLGVRGFFTAGDQLAIQRGESVQVMNIASDTAMTPLEGTQAIISPNGQKLVLFKQGTVVVYDLPRVTVSKIMVGQYGSVEEPQLSADLQYLAAVVSSDPVGCCVGGPDKLMVWQVASGRIQLELSLNQYSRRATFSPDGQYLVLTDSDHIDFILISSGKVTQKIEGFTNTVLGIKFSPDNQNLAAAYFGLRSLRIWGYNSGKVEKELEDPNNSNLGLPSGLAFSPDGKILAGNGIFWNLTRDSRNLELERKLFENKLGITSVTFHPFQQSLAVGFSDGSLRFWDLDDNSLIHELHRLNGEVVNLAFSDDGSKIAVVQAYPNFTVQVWLYEEYYPKFLMIRGEYYRQAIFSTDGNYLAILAASRQKDYELNPPGQIEIWSLINRKQILKFGMENITRIAYSPDGKLLAGGLFDQGAIQIWNSETGVLLGTLNGQVGHVIDVAFSPDGTLLASASDDGTIFLWSISVQN